jgi:TetR/AcrR family transcriptional repressor of nem operon
MAKLLEHGYNGLGIQALLDAARAPRGSFYHHFADKEDFALQVIDQYMRGVHAALDACMADRGRPPLERVRRFFELTLQSYEREGYMGCLLGGLGQELSCASAVFRQKIESCIATIAEGVAAGLEEARLVGDIPAGSDARRMASLLVDCWEGAALRSRLRSEPAPLVAMLDFYFSAFAGSQTASRGSA